MSENVKFIFKTLIKVPIIILVTYAIFNLFAFSLSYFKMLGVSYVAMQTAVENNYIPTTEWNTLENYLFSLESEMLENTTSVCDTGTGNRRVQYGSPITVEVSAHYRFIWPLQPAEQHTTGQAAAGLAGTTNTGAELTDDQLEQNREDIASNPQNNITIRYTVPGLKYYPDLS